VSDHWRLAVWSTVWMVVLAVPVGVAVSYAYGKDHAGAFGYGVGVGLLSFVSTALTVSLIAGRSMAGGMMIGGFSFAARYGFSAGALGIPAYLELWPVLAMLGGFAGVYLAETIVLLPRGMTIMSRRTGREV